MFSYVRDCDTEVYELLLIIVRFLVAFLFLMCYVSAASAFKTVLNTDYSVCPS